MEKSGFGKTLLKVCGVFFTIGSVLVLVLAILALTNKVPEINTAVMDMVKDYNCYSQLPANFPGLALMVSFAISLIEVYLIWRAVKDPKKSTFLIVLCFIALIGNGVMAVVKGVTSSTTSGIIWSTVLLIALLCARCELEVAETNEKKVEKKAVKKETKKKE
ncbi:MAG: hypothetical protein IKF97_03130 [Clostridia bacterium]|nr:hypothetical protein [Clostridia bacterium]